MSVWLIQIIVLVAMISILLETYQTTIAYVLITILIMGHQIQFAIYAIIHGK